MLQRRPYSQHPPRSDYVLTPAGEGLLPVLIALQDWGDRFVLGDGSLTAGGAPTSAEARRVRSLVGRRIRALSLHRHDGGRVDPLAEDRWTVLYCFPGAFAPGSDGYPPGWDQIPGTKGCTLESRTYAEHHDEFARAGADIRGVSTQRPDQLAAFVAHAGLPFPLLSDADSLLAAVTTAPHVPRLGGRTGQAPHPARRPAAHGASRPVPGDTTPPHRSPRLSTCCVPWQPNDKGPGSPRPCCLACGRRSPPPGTPDEPRPASTHRGKSPVESSVREGGVEPPHPFGHTDLNRARLPIPPLARAGEG